LQVVIADDAPLIREGLARLLTDLGIEVIGQAADSPSLLTLVANLHPDVAIVDIRMPPTHTDEGLVAAQLIRSRHPSVGVLVLSQYLEPAYAMRLVAESPKGVGYLLKEHVGRVEEVARACRSVAAGECVIDRAVVEELVARRRRHNPLDRLTSREQELLSLMAEGRSNQGICDQLFLSPKTVETHIRSVFTKLDLADVPEDNRRVLAVLTYLRG
jgi:DNA-binding NarL/FixJ family response regulator